MNEIGHYGSLFLTQALKKNITLTSIEPFKRVVECNAGIQGMLERRAVDTEEVAIKGKELEMLQQTMIGRQAVLVNTTWRFYEDRLC